MNFPCEFTIKVVGTVEANLEAIIVPVLRKNNVDIERTKISSRLSKEGKYSSFSIILEAQSQEQLDNIYRELSGNPNVLFAL